MFLSLAWAPWLIGILTVLFLLVCVMMILTVLIQRPQGGGLSGAFGSGAGSGQTAFGAKTGDALTWFTIIVFVLFVGFAVVLNYAHTPEKVVPGAASVQPANSEPTGAGGAAEPPATPAAETPAPTETPGTGADPAAAPPAETPKTEDKPAAPPATPPAEPAPQPK